jgi:hypothetical protein
LVTCGYAGNLRTQEPLPRLRPCGGFIVPELAGPTEVKGEPPGSSQSLRQPKG